MITQSEKSSSGVGTLVWFLTGVGVGLLFAAKPGRETRQQLADYFNKSGAKDLLRKGQEGIETAKDRMSSEGGKEPFYESGKYT